MSELQSFHHTSVVVNVLILDYLLLSPPLKKINHTFFYVLKNI
nr:MAG TPA: hypothetical protein [Bacteriophage sp.]